MSDYSTPDFIKLKTAVAKQFALMRGLKMLKTKTDPETLWSTYLSSFPRGTDPKYKRRTQHDCNACKAFVLEVGNVVAQKDGKYISLWDIKIDEPAYQAVANAMSNYVKSQSLGDNYTPSGSSIGLDKSRVHVASSTAPGKTEQIEWDHFFIDLTAKIETPANDNPEATVPHECFIRILTPYNLPEAIVGSDYSLRFETSHCGGADCPVWFSRGASPYPNGLTLKDGVLSGKPATAGVFSFDISASLGGMGDGHNANISKKFTLTVAAEVVKPEAEQPEHTTEGIVEEPVIEDHVPQEPENIIPATVEENDADEIAAVNEDDEGRNEMANETDNNINGNENGAGNAPIPRECSLRIVTSNLLPNITVGTEYSTMLEAEHDGDETCEVYFSTGDNIVPEWVFINEDGQFVCTPPMEGTFTFTLDAGLYAPDQRYYGYTNKTFTIVAVAAAQEEPEIDPTDEDFATPQGSTSYDLIEKAIKGIVDRMNEDREKNEDLSLPGTCYGTVVYGEDEPVSGARITLEGWVDASAERGDEELYAITGKSGGFTIHMPDKYNFRSSITIRAEKGMASEIIRKRPDEIIIKKGNLGVITLNADFAGESTVRDMVKSPAKKSTAMSVAGGEGDNGFEFSTDNSPGMQFSYNLLHRLIEPEIGTPSGTLSYQWQLYDKNYDHWYDMHHSYANGTKTTSVTYTPSDDTVEYESRLRCRVTYKSSYVNENQQGYSTQVFSPVTILSPDPDAVNTVNNDGGGAGTQYVKLLTQNVLLKEKGKAANCRISVSLAAFERSRSKLVNPVNVGDYKNALFRNLDNITRMRSLGMGYVLKMTQSWRPDGFALGNLLYSTVLAPGEQQRLVVRERSESYTVQDTDDSSASIGETYTMDQGDNISHVYNEAVDQYDEAHSKSVVKSKGWSIGGSLGGGISGGGASAMLSVSGGYQNTKTTTELDSNQSHSLDTASSAASTFQRLIKGAAERLTQSKRMGIRMATGSESDSVTTKLISNHNHSHSLTMQYWEVVRKYKLETCIDDVSLVVYIPMELINFGTGDDVFTEMNALHKNKNYNKNPSKLLSDRYNDLLRHHDVLRAYLPAEQQSALALLRKFSALPKWDLERISQNEKPATLTLTVYGSFMPYDKISARLHLKNGRVIEGFQKNYETQSMPPQFWEVTTGKWTVTKGIDSRQKLYRKLEDRRKNTEAGNFSFEVIVPPEVIDDDYEYIEITHNYDSQVTYDLFQSDEAKVAYNNYKNKMLNSVEDNKKTDYDIMKAGFHEILAEAVMEPVVTMDSEMLRSFGPPVISLTTLSTTAVGSGSAEPTIIETCIDIKEDTGDYLDKIIEADTRKPVTGQAAHDAVITVFDVLYPFFEALGWSYGATIGEIGALITTAIDIRIAGKNFSDNDAMVNDFITKYNETLEKIITLMISAGMGTAKLGQKAEQMRVETLSSGRLKLEDALSFHLSDSRPTLRYADLQKIETMKRHVLENGVYYSQAVWASLSADERALLFEKYTIEMPASEETVVDVNGDDQKNGEPAETPIDKNGARKDPDSDNIHIPGMDKTQGTSIPLMNCVINQPLGFYGNCMVLPFVYPPQLAEALGATSATLQNALYQYHTQAFRVPTSTISLPTTGMMGDAMLGKNNASEKIDLTRFWNWDDAPIPEADHITSNYFKTNNLLDNRVAPESSLPQGSVTTMPISESLLDSVTASNILQAMVAKSPDFADLSGYAQLQALSTSESQARTQLAQQTAQTTQKALETAMQQHSTQQQAEAVQASVDKSLKLATGWRDDAKLLEDNAAVAEASAKAKREEKHKAAEGETLSETQVKENDEIEAKAKQFEDDAKADREKAAKLRSNAAEVEKNVINYSLTTLSSIYTAAKPASNAAGSGDRQGQQTQNQQTQNQQAQGGKGNTTAQ